MLQKLQVAGYRWTLTNYILHIIYIYIHILPLALYYRDTFVPGTEGTKY